ncbi:MAG: tetratricopeptide repeat protein [Candidatus Riflebacteria bacterium]|nr:tetratricopeptide repeat protein [Candidatus Riflebacteria bacterium]
MFYKNFIRISVVLFSLSIGMPLFAASAKMHIDVGLNHFYKKRFLEAFQEFKTASEIDPRNAEARYNLARIYKLQGYLREAVEELQTALVLMPDYQPARRELAEIKKLIEKDISSSRKPEIKQSQIVIPEISAGEDSYERRAQALLKAGNIEGAIAALEESAKKNTFNAKTCKTLGYLYYRKSKFFDAVMWYEKAAQLSPSDPDIALDMGIVYFKIEDYDKAISFFDRALKYSPEMVKAHYAIGETYEKMGRYEDAAFQFRKCLELNPGLTEANDKLRSLSERLGFTYFSRGSMFFQQGDYVKAEPLLSLAATYGALTEAQKRQTEEMLGSARYWLNKEKNKEALSLSRQKVKSESYVNKTISVDDAAKNQSEYAGQAVQWSGMAAFRDTDSSKERIFINVDQSVSSDSNMDYVFGIVFPQKLPNDPRVSIYSTNIQVKGKIIGFSKLMNTITHVSSFRRQPLIDPSEVTFTREGYTEPLVIRYY